MDKHSKRRLNRKIDVGQVRKSINDEYREAGSRTREFVISTDSRDRYGTVINMNGWDLSNYNGTVGYQHEVYGSFWGDGSNPDQALGIGEAFLEGDMLIGRVTFEPADMNTLADKIMKKVDFGTLKSTSVGFLETGEGEWRDFDGQRTYFFEGQELLEWSIVNIPANPEANARKYEETREALGARKFVEEIHARVGSHYSVNDIENMSLLDIAKVFEGENLEQDDQAQKEIEKEVARQLLKNRILRARTHTIKSKIKF